MKLVSYTLATVAGVCFIGGLAITVITLKMEEKVDEQKYLE